jgi:hypothetical protein
VTPLRGLRHNTPQRTDPYPLRRQPGGIAWANSEAITKKLRHVNLREVAIRDSLRDGAIVLGHIPGKLNPSDLFTKEMKDATHFALLPSALMSQRDMPTELGARGC